MGAFSKETDATGKIDAIIFVKDPRCVLDEPESYWFKCLVKERTRAVHQRNILNVAFGLHYRIAHYSEYYAAVRAVEHGKYRPLLV